MAKKWLPPEKIRDLSDRSASNLISLIRDVQNSPVTLVLGSGVSASAGLPTWPEFLKGICESFFMHWEWEIESNERTPLLPPKGLSIIGAVNEYLSCSPEIKNIAGELASKDPLLVAQQIKNCIREADWRYLCIKVLNNDDQYMINLRSKLLRNLVNFCSINKNIKSVINYNYDNLFEIYLNSKGINHAVIWESRSKKHNNAISIYHPHGCLPIKGGPSSKIVLAESDYHEESVAQYSWANLIQSQLFSTSMCVFLGTSMTDPNIRRILRVSSTVSSFHHYVFLPSSRKPRQSEIMLNALFDNDLYKLGVKTIRYPKNYSKNNRYSRLTTLIEFINLSLV